jgi:hypothetical protein
MVSKRANELLVQVEDLAVSEETLAAVTSELQKDFVQLEGVAGVRPKPKTAPKRAKPVEPNLLGCLLVKLIASGGALTGIVSIARSWIKGSASRIMTLQYGKDKLVIKGASSGEQEKAISEWINHHANQGSASIKSKSATVLAEKRAAKRSKPQGKPKKVVPSKKGVRRSS